MVVRYVRDAVAVVEQNQIHFQELKIVSFDCVPKGPINNKSALV